MKTLADLLTPHMEHAVVVRKNGEVEVMDQEQFKGYWEQFEKRSGEKDEQRRREEEE